jgi:hypothetical protein
MLDHYRENPLDTLKRMMDARRELDPSFEPPWLVKLLAWMFLTSKSRKVFGKIALRFLGVRTG